MRKVDQRLAKSNLQCYASQCCEDMFTDEESELLDDTSTMAESISEEEKSPLYFISGYVAYKEALGEEKENVPFHHACEFTDHADRGKLSYPPDNLFCFSIHAYVYFINQKSKCVNHNVKAFERLHDSLSFDIPKCKLKAVTVCKLLL